MCRGKTENTYPPQERMIIAFSTSPAKRIVETAEAPQAPHVVGSVPLPSKTERFTIRRSADFIDKDSHEHFEIRTHNRLIDVLRNMQEEIQKPLIC